MKTQAQIKAEIYNAITGDSTLNSLIGGRIQWLLRPTTAQDRPLMTYQILDTVGSYVQGGCVTESHEQIDLQIDIYTNDITKMDSIHENLKRVMHSKGYRQITGGEFIEGSEVVRATRWTVLNV